MPFKIKKPRDENSPKENKKPNAVSSLKKDILFRLEKVGVASWIQEKKEKLKSLRHSLKTMEFGNKVAIDLGTASVLVFVEGKGIVLQEPSVVAVDGDTGRVIRIGLAAQRMIGRTPGKIQSFRPLKDGVISQYDATSRMLKYFLKRACGTMFFPPKVLICIPTGATEVEERAVIDASREAGAQKTYLIEEPVAAAIGAGLDIYQPNGVMIVDIGGGTTDIAVISLGGVVVSQSIKVAGDSFDSAIQEYLKRKRHITVGDATAERVKIELGNIIATEDDNETMTVRGCDDSVGAPMEITVSSVEIRDALREPVQKIISNVQSVIGRTPPELLSDLVKNGIVMTGGGSLLRGFDRLMKVATRINTRLADNPVECVVLGTGKQLNDLEYMAEGPLNLAKEGRYRL